MNMKLFRLRRIVLIQFLSVSILWMGGLDPAWGLDKAGALMSIAAQSASPVKYSLDEKNGTISWMSGEFKPAVPGDPVESAYKFLESHRKAFQVQNPREEFTLMSVKKGLLQPTDHVYLEQKIKGIPVWNRRLGFHYDKQGRLYAVNGKYVAVPEQALNTEPTLTKEEAFVIAVEDFKKNPNKAPSGTTSAQWPVSSHPLPIDQQIPCKGELMFYQDSADNLRLTYCITFSITAPPGDWVCFVDVVTGSVLMKYNLIMTAGPAVGSGLDLFNNVVPLNTYLDTDGKYKLIDTTKAMYTQHSTPSNTTYAGCIEIRDAAHNQDPPNNCSVVSDPDGDNVFTSGGSDPKQNYQSAVSLARNLSGTYDLFAWLYNRNSLDGKGLSMVAHVHVGDKYQNAFWRPWTSMMYFGDNADTGWPYARADDVVCHEAAHGLNTFEVPPSGYTYHRQSGAVNDSHSDIAGAMLDYADWSVGEDDAKDGIPSRRMDDPTAVASPQPKDMYDYQVMTDDVDGGGNHCDCSLGNYFVYQLAMRLPAETPASDGRFTAGRIAYRSQIYGAANPEVTWREWGQYIKQAAVDLYGPGDIYGKVVEALNVVHIPQALFGIYDNWTYKYGDDQLPFYFWLYRTGYPCMPVVSVRFTRPSTDAKLKTVAINLKDLSDIYCKFRIWYCGANSDGSPDENTKQLLFDNNSPSVIRTDGIFNNFKLTDSISVASDFHIALDIYEGYYLGIYYDTGDPAAGRSWVKYYSSWWEQPRWYKSTDPNNLLIRVIYETTPLSVPLAPTLSSPSDGETVNNANVTFSWNSVSGADRYFLEVNSSASWDESTRVYFATVYNTSQTTSGFPVGVNYWRVWAGNADAWSCASETRSFTETVQPPTLSCSVSSMSARATPNQASFNQSFDVWNSGNGTVTYSIADNVGWLSISPTNGTSTGESDTIQVTYNPSGLSTGVYSATITVSASGAYGSPKTIAVTFTVLNMSPLAADFDGDRLADPAVVISGNWYVWLSSCGYYRLGPFGFSESGWTPAAGDFDGDGLADPSGMDTNGNWYVRFSYSGYLQGGPYPLGDSSYSPLIADFDGDGYADTAGMSASGGWLIWFSSSGYLRGGPYAFGGAGWVPRSGDFDGDRLADPAAVDASGGWYIWFSSSGYLRGGPYAVGTSGLTAVAGDFDGDRRADTAGTDCAGSWYLWLSSAGYQVLGPITFALP